MSKELWWCSATVAGLHKGDSVTVSLLDREFEGIVTARTEPDGMTVGVVFHTPGGEFSRWTDFFDQGGVCKHGIWLTDKDRKIIEQAFESAQQPALF